jgi:glutathione peroxidase
MLTKILITTVFYILTGVVDVYTYSVPLIEGGNQSLAAFEHKKILIFSLPVTQSASADSMLYSLDTLGTAHINNLVIIAVPSYEAGYTEAQKNVLQQWYRSILGQHIIVTDGLYTRKLSGTQQHGLFHWLTSVTGNNTFDIDDNGPGSKFFVNEEGELYAVLHPYTKISSITVNKIITDQ